MVNGKKRRALLAHPWCDVRQTERSVKERAEERNYGISYESGERYYREEKKTEKTQREDLAQP
jgi:hypothetical protein